MSTIDMSGWRTIGQVWLSTVVRVPTDAEILAAHEEGRRIRAHYAREIAAMRRGMNRREVVR